MMVLAKPLAVTNKAMRCVVVKLLLEHILYSVNSKLKYYIDLIINIYRRRDRHLAKQRQNSFLYGLLIILIHINKTGQES